MNRLTTRLVLSHLLVIAVAMGLLGFLLLSFVQNYFEQAVQDSLLAQARLVARGLTASPPLTVTNVAQAMLPAASNAVQQQGQAVSPGPGDVAIFALDNATLRITSELETRVRLVDVNGIVLQDSNAADLGKDVRGDALIEAALAGQEGTRTEPGQILVAVPLDAGERVKGAVYLSQPLRDLAAVLADLRVRLGMSAGIALALSTLAGLALARAIARPVRELTTAADRLAQGDFDYPLSTTSPEELAHLARSFRSMRDELQHALQLRTDLVTNVSHELRTPLTAIKGLTETLQDGAVDDVNARDGFLASIETQTDRLIRLVNDLLVLSRADAQALSLRKERLDLASIADACASELAPRAAMRNLSISVQGGPAFVQGDSDRLRQVFVNLLDNGLRFSPPGETVTITLRKDTSEIAATVHDNGRGIPAADLPFVFDRFYCGDRSRQRSNEGASGSGLGLAIAKALVEAHGGRISIESSASTGTSATFSLPAV